MIDVNKLGLKKEENNGGGGSSGSLSSESDETFMAPVVTE